MATPKKKTGDAPETPEASVRSTAAKPKAKSKPAAKPKATKPKAAAKPTKVAKPKATKSKAGAESATVAKPVASRKRKSVGGKSVAAPDGHPPAPSGALAAPGENVSAPDVAPDVPEPAATASESLLPPMAGPEFPETQYAVVEKLLVGFLAREVRKVGLSRAVLGLSGGVDSAVSAALAARALGAKNVLGVMMPYRSSSAGSLADATEVAESLGIETLVVEITEQVDAYFERFPDAPNLRRGNKMARERMTILYDHSAANEALVIGTSNKTELLLGYGTLYGDMASALNPIGDLYKTQVWGLARHLGLPRSVIEKAPTADLWDGQTDETELGFSYHQVDRLLYRMIDERCSRDELLAMGFDEGFVDRISRTVRMSQFKRRLPVIAKISARSIDTDFRYSRDWGH